MSHNFNLVLPQYKEILRWVSPGIPGITLIALFLINLLKSFANHIADFSVTSILGNILSSVLFSFRYVEKYGLPGPCDDFEKVIRYVARATGYLKSKLTMLFCIFCFLSVGSFNRCIGVMCFQGKPP